MEQKIKIESTIEKAGMIWNLPITFSVNNRRPITIKCPTVRELFSDINLKKFLAHMALTPEKIKETKTQLPFTYNTPGDIIKGLITFTEHAQILVKYFLKYIENSKFENKEILVDNEKIYSYEFEYIIKVILTSVNQINFEEFEEAEKEEEEMNPIIKEILRKQKESEKKLKKIKNSKDKSKGLTIEDITLAIVYEFHLQPEYLLGLNYFGLVWYFSYVGKVDAHKLNQMILSSGMSKQKSYSYWLNK